MFCINCGKQIPDGTKFCGFCGASQKAASDSPVQPAPPRAHAEEVHRKERDKTTSIIWIIAAILIIAAVALVLIFVVFPDGFGGNDKPIATHDRDDENARENEDELEDDTEDSAEDALNDTEDATDDAASDTAADTTDNEPASGLVGTGYDVGDTMYDFSVPTLDGGTFTLSENLGKPVFINIFATWCPPCVGELPDIEALYKEYGDQVTFIIVDEGESMATAQTFASDNGYTMPFAYAESGNFLANYNIDFIPQTFVLDASGKVVEYLIGGNSYETFENAITTALGAS